jgi:hypothetical protein
MNPLANMGSGVLTPNLDHEALKAAIRETFQRVFADPDQIPLFFTDDYLQTTDGVMCDRTEFEEHIRHLASMVESNPMRGAGRVAARATYCRPTPGPPSL